ncbi:probable 1-acyl-sn-glycerol-3-phosphate acyltransferase 5 [Physcomitrium patens]|uniref:1-acylglycerol-3-phosphate O-acyltransferase n=2 Tax=Physcomitrium patens TaxID=3218 RepID=A9SI03_PHYPA|nr:probable 1-acyl-sn-glycerol-3-phosphate acyltransferase 5 [Physcomitrium patens]PNR45327.1 hypothetical protein PHYPA_015098 [Physcomitrium patens]|eukprot:XP_024389863.1 probable 1-acyl-sn-glycerol-3-phosphate acyltransferase 5 [Physcomitrella patens]
MPTPPGDAYASKPGAESLSLDDLGDQAPAMYSSQGDKLHLHRPLTLFRRVRGLVCLAILLLTAFVALVLLSPVVHFLPRFFSVHYSRLWTSYFIGNWLSMWPYLFEEVNETKVIFAGDKVPKENRVMVMCNHRTEVDWMYIWNLAIRKGKIGYCKYAVKNSVKNLPLFGWAFYVFEFLMLHRKWEVDAPVIKTYIDSFQDKRDPLWLVVFPEGTDFSEAKRDTGNAIGREKGYPELVNVLQPRTRGFVTCLSQSRCSLDAVYDLTIGYKKRCPLFINNVFGTDPSEVHIHIRRIPISEIPQSEDGMTQWLYDLFYQKDQMLASFSKTGSFPDSGIEESPLNIVEGVCNVALHVVLSGWVFWCLFHSVWLKLYVAFASLLLAFSTYFDWRPKPVYSSLRTKRKIV